MFVMILNMDVRLYHPRILVVVVALTVLLQLTLQMMMMLRITQLLKMESQLPIQQYHALIQQLLIIYD